MEYKKISRRSFLNNLAAGGAVSSAAIWARSNYAQTNPSAPQNLRFGKPVLAENDFSYLGSFKLPTSSGGKSAELSRGLTHRYVSGQLRFFTTTQQGPSTGHGEVYEIYDPGYAKSNYPTATVVRHWRDIAGDKYVDESSHAGIAYNYGLFWDPIGLRLYWSYGSDFNTTAPNNPCLGYSTLNDETGIATPVAAYRIGDCKFHQFGMTAIPSWFASMYLGGKRLGVGFGGYCSAITAGPASDGPVLSAIDPPSGEHLSSLSYTNLVGYPFQSPWTYYQKRSPDYIDGNTGPGHPRGPFGSYGGWQWMDHIKQSAVWIDMPNKHGFVVFAGLGTGKNWYENSDRHSDGYKHSVFVYNPYDFADVAMGRKNYYDVQASGYWDIQFPTYGYPRGAQSGEPYAQPQGITFDSTSNRLYILLPWTNGNYPTVSVFQIS
jgi:hypothetical protein